MQTKPCTNAIEAMRKQSFEAHVKHCKECQSFIKYMETLSAEEGRKHLVLLSMQLTGDSTEIIRNLERERINARALERERLEARYGQVWNTEELGKDFTVVGFSAPYIVVKKKSTGEMGSLQFQHSPRYYFSWDKA